MEKIEEQKEEAVSLESRIISAILCGVNRVFPFAPSDLEIYVQQIDSLFVLVHKTSFPTVLQVLTLLLQVSFFIFLFSFFPFSSFSSFSN
jgi:hypothetical protein